jgi:hypothetical protein
LIKQLIIWPQERRETRVSINRMIKSLLLTMLSDSALTLLGPLNSTVPGCRDRVVTGRVKKTGSPSSDDRQRIYMEIFEWAL